MKMQLAHELKKETLLQCYKFALLNVDVPYLTEQLVRTQLAHDLCLRCNFNVAAPCPKTAARADVAISWIEDGTLIQCYNCTIPKCCHILSKRTAASADAARLFLFLSELMDIFVAGRDQSAADQPNNLAEGHPPL